MVEHISYTQSFSETWVQDHLFFSSFRTALGTRWFVWEGLGRGLLQSPFNRFSRTPVPRDLAVHALCQGPPTSRTRAAVDHQCAGPPGTGRASTVVACLCSGSPPVNGAVAPTGAGGRTVVIVGLESTLARRAMFSHALVWPLELGIRTPTLHCAGGVCDPRGFVPKKAQKSIRFTKISSPPLGNHLAEVGRSKPGRRIYGENATYPPILAFLGLFVYPTPRG